jgi:hypothetical protein
MNFIKLFLIVPGFRLLNSTSNASSMSGRRQRPSNSPNNYPLFSLNVTLMSSTPVTPSTSSRPVRRRMRYYKPSSMTSAAKFKHFFVRLLYTRILLLPISRKKMGHRVTQKALMLLFPTSSLYSSISPHSKSSIPSISRSFAI